MPLYLKPHSAEWFAAMEKGNPSRAAQTRQILSLAGRNDVCSICGDESSTAYKLVADELPDDVVATVRLCDDCLRIRNEVYGEDFVPYEE